MDKPSDRVIFNQQLDKMFNPTAGFVHILPSTGLYLTKHFLKCSNEIINYDINDHF